MMFVESSGLLYITEVYVFTFLVQTNASVIAEWCQIPYIYLTKVAPSSPHTQKGGKRQQQQKEDVSSNYLLRITITSI